MTPRPAPDALARELLDEFGLDGLQQAAARAEACRQGGDAEGVRFWNAVVRAMRLLAPSRDATAGGEGAQDVCHRIHWRLMQRVEHCRHRATECRRLASGASDTVRAELLEMEQGWLELAAYAELLADEPKP